MAADSACRWAADILTQRAAISKWLYAFYPFATEHNTGYGTIAVKILEAIHLPATDIDFAAAAGQGKVRCSLAAAGLGAAACSGHMRSIRVGQFGNERDRAQEQGAADRDKSYLG